MRGSGVGDLVNKNSLLVSAMRLIDLFLRLSVTDLTLAHEGGYEVTLQGGYRAKGLFGVGRWYYFDKEPK